jgi:hypothetical protein
MMMLTRRHRVLLCIAGSLTLGIIGCSQASTSPELLDSTKEDTPNSSVVAGASDRSGEIKKVEDLEASINSASFDEHATFWSAMAVEGSEQESYTNLAEMTEAATAVIVGRIASIGETRTIVADPVTGQKFDYPGLQIDVLSVLAGELPTLNGSNSGQIRLEPLRTLAKVPDDGVFLLFLRWKGEGAGSGGDPPDTVEGDKRAYRLVNGQGVYLEGPNGARNPLSEAQYGFLEEDGKTPVDPIVREVGSRSLGELIRIVTA